MTLGTILIIAGAVLVVLALIGERLKKLKPEKEKDEEKVLENVAVLNDQFNRARYQNEDGK